jgi:uncharacterized protein YndB with AHSA1/START domain
VALPVIEKETTVDAPIAEVWRAWTTSEGAVTFFAPEANIELRIGGPYELFFDLDAPPGSRGAEGMTVLSYAPPHTLSFTWCAPPHLPNVRRERMWIVVRLDEVSPGRTRVRLANLGWGEGGEWEEAHAYFRRAWDIVLTRLRQRFAQGPIDWDKV